MSLVHFMDIGLHSCPFWWLSVCQTVGSNTSEISKGCFL